MGLQIGQPSIGHHIMVCLENLTNSDLEEVVKCSQAKNSEIYNVLKIACLVTKDNKKYEY